MNHNFRLNKKNVFSMLILLLCVIMSMSTVFAEEATNNSDVMSTYSQDNLNSGSESNSISENIVDESVSNSGSESNSISENIVNESVSNSGSESNSISENKPGDVKSDNFNIIKLSEDKSVLKDDSEKLYIYISSDKLVNTTYDKEFLQAIKAKIGDRATVIIDPNSPNPGEVERTIKNAGQGIAAYIANFCAGTTYGLVQYDMRGYLSEYSQKLDGVCFVYYGSIPVATTDYIARAWDDNFSDPYFAGLYSPYKYMTEGGLSFIQARANGDSRDKMIETIAEGLLAYAKAAKTVNKPHTKFDNISEIFVKYVATHETTPIELANDANNILNGKTPNLELSKWIYYSAEYVGALPIKNTDKIFSLPKTVSASTFKNSITLSRINYRTLALQIKEYMDKNGAAPAFITYNNVNITFNDYCYMLAKIISNHTTKTKFKFPNSYTITKSPINFLNLKKTSNIVAFKKTFKRKVKIKKYTVSLKYKKGIKNARLTLKIAKKTYKAKTNKNGKATFKITKLTKRGKYKATIKFAGSKIYNSSTKTVNITIK